MDTAEVLRLQAGNGMGQEDSQMIIEGMAKQGAEPTYCMGDDTPLPVLSSRPHVLYDYFKQRFAQVCNSRLGLLEWDSEVFSEAIVKNIEAPDYLLHHCCVDPRGVLKRISLTLHTR